MASILMCDGDALISRLRAITGRSEIITRPAAMRRYIHGYRYGSGPALAVVIPASAVSLWHVLQTCVDHDAAIIVQAANTGLTGGSTPDGDDYGRPVVIISTKRLDTVHLLGKGEQVLCHAGATLYRLEKMLAPLGREPHSVIGSSCIGASVVGGVCNNSGGALVQRGPAYTQFALFARVNDHGHLELVNKLGIDLGRSPGEILGRLDQGRHSRNLIDTTAGAASDGDYAHWVRRVDAPTPARYNADPRRLFDASGCAGKLVVFAVRLDSFPKPDATRVFYIGTNDPGVLTRLRRSALSGLAELPIAAEYMHRSAFDIADRYGRDSFHAIARLGTQRLPVLARAKDLVARLGAVWGAAPGYEERVLQCLSRLLPDPLPPRIRDFRDRYAHHLMIRCTKPTTTEWKNLLSLALPDEMSGWFECDKAEGEAAFLHRFVAAGAAVRYRAVHQNRVSDVVALDVALRRNDDAWFETLPDDIEDAIVDRLYYGHFFCHVFHQDYLIARDVDPLEIEHRMWLLLDARGAEYPAEHNVGHLYPAKASLKSHYRSLDPSNTLNPGIGGASKRKYYREDSPASSDRN